MHGDRQGAGNLAQGLVDFGQLLEALLGPSLRSRNPERRKEALQSLESLAATVSHLKHLLLVRDLRRLAGE